MSIVCNIAFTFIACTGPSTTAQLCTVTTLTIGSGDQSILRRFPDPLPNNNNSRTSSAGSHVCHRALADWLVARETVVTVTRCCFFGLTSC